MVEDTLAGAKSKRYGAAPATWPSAGPWPRSPAGTAGSRRTGPWLRAAHGRKTCFRAQEADAAGTGGVTPLLSGIGAKGGGPHPNGGRGIGTSLAAHPASGRPIL